MAGVLDELGIAADQVEVDPLKYTVFRTGDTFRFEGRITPTKMFIIHVLAPSQRKEFLVKKDVAIGPRQPLVYVASYAPVSGGGYPDLPDQEYQGVLVSDPLGENLGLCEGKAVLVVEYGHSSTISHYLPVIVKDTLEIIKT